MHHGPHVLDRASAASDWPAADGTRSARGDLPEAIRPGRWPFGSGVPADVAMPDLSGDFPCDPVWTAPATRLT